MEDSNIKVRLIDSEYGKSLVSATYIKESDIILQEDAMFSLEEEESECVPLMDILMKYIKLARSLTPETLQFVRTLELHPDSEFSMANKEIISDYDLNIELKDNVALLQSVVQFNAFSEGVHSESKLVHVFKNTSRCNHSCIPNVDFEIENGKITLKAIEDIPEGEHLMINYLGDSSIFDPTSERRRALQSRFLFECQCPYCILESEKDASKIHRLFYLLCNSPNPSSEDLEYLVQQLTKFIESNYPYSYGFLLLEQMEMIVKNSKEKEILEDEIEFMSNEVKEVLEPKPSPENHRSNLIEKQSHQSSNVSEVSSSAKENIDIPVNEDNSKMKCWGKTIICAASLTFVSIIVSAAAYGLKYEF